MSNNGILDKVEKERGLQASFPPDTMEHIGNTDLVQLSRKLLDSVVTSTDALNSSTMTEEKIKEMKVVLGYLNATNNIVKTKMQYFKMLGVGEKVEAIKRRAKEIE